MGRFILFIEVVRAMDYWGHMPRPLSATKNEITQSFALMYRRWNGAAAELFEPLEPPGAFALMESTQRSRKFATGLTQELGKVSLLRGISNHGLCRPAVPQAHLRGDDMNLKMISPIFLASSGGTALPI